MLLRRGSDGLLGDFKASPASGFPSLTSFQNLSHLLLAEDLCGLSLFALNSVKSKRILFLVINEAQRGYGLLALIYYLVSTAMEGPNQRGPRALDV